MIDNFTKYPELLVLNEGTAAVIADKLAQEYIPRAGAPKQSCALSVSIKLIAFVHRVGFSFIFNRRD